MSTLYKATRNAYCNCEKRIYPGVGQYNIPEILPQDVDLTDAEVLGFNYAKGEDFPEENSIPYKTQETIR